MKHFIITSGLALSFAACSDAPSAPADPQDTFFANLSELCGQSYKGRVISDDEADADWRTEILTMHVRECSDTQIKIPLHVGENRSRTWIITQTETGLKLKHDHRHEDGSPDAVTFYGGNTATLGSATKQAFPVDQESIDLFLREGLDVSITNTWTLEIEPGATFTYGLFRESRDFRAAFDLSETVDNPPPPWGFED